MPLSNIRIRGFFFFFNFKRSGKVLLGSKFYWTNYGKWLAKMRDIEKETFKNMKKTYYIHIFNDNFSTTARHFI